ncbi:MAG TPA: ABC transporter substrate-binding protein [Candidatus Binatia bacterium]|jgi:NitT/TauT family transport system substrate-binding protein
MPGFVSLGNERRLAIDRLVKGLVFFCFLHVAVQDGHASSKIFIAYAGITSGVATLWISQEQGFFRRYGIDADVIAIRNTPTQLAALISGDIQIGFGGGSAVVGAAPGGADLKIIATFVNSMVLNIVVRPEIKKIEDLHGKRLGVQSLGGTSWMYTLLALQHLGLEPTRDKISIVAAGDNVVRAQALEAGIIDGTVSSDDSLNQRLRQKGFLTLLEISHIPITSQAIVVRKDYLQQQQDFLENVLKALVESVAFIRSPQNKPRVIKTVMKHLRLFEPAAAEAGYKSLVRVLDRKPYTSREGLRNIQRMLQLNNPRVGTIKVEDLVDSTLVTRLDESGFIDRIYGNYGVNR